LILKLLVGIFALTKDEIELDLSTIEDTDTLAVELVDQIFFF